MGRVVVLVAGSAAVHSLVRGSLDVLNGEGSIVNALSHVGGQSDVVLLPDDALDGVAGHRALYEECFPCDGRYSTHRADVGHP